MNCRFLLLTGTMLGIAISGTAWEIVTPEKPSPAEKTAAAELQNYLQKAVKKDVLTNNRSTRFVIGNTPETIAAKVLPQAAPDETWRIKSSTNTIYLCGTGTRGTLYAVYNFLEKHVGVRWWNQVEEYVPQYDTLPLKTLDETGRPYFAYRDIFISGIAHDNGRFAVRRRLNRYGDRPITADFGGSYNYGPPYFVHTFAFYINPKDYFAQKPEFFALRKGKRCRTQLCLTNEELPGLMVEKMKKFIVAAEKEAAKRGVAAPKIYSVSQNDDWEYCQCPKCEAVVKAEKAPSGLLLRFVNGIAREIGKFRPDIYIDTLAYYQNEEAPAVTRPEKNVIIRLCTTRYNLVRECDDQNNKLFNSMLKDWSGISPQLFVWHYAITYGGFGRDPYGALLPLPSEAIMGQFMRAMAKNKVRGIFFEHEHAERADLHTFKVYLESKLLENPFDNVAAITADFMSKYYGAAGKYISEYRALLAKAVRQNDGNVVYDGALDTYRFIDPATMAAGRKILLRARQAVAKDPLLLHRVNCAAMGLDAYYAMQSEMFAATDAELRDTLDRLIGTWQKRCSMNNYKSQPLPLRDFIVQRKLLDSPEKLPAALPVGKIIQFRCHQLNTMLRDSRKIADAEAFGGHAAELDAAKGLSGKMPFAFGIYDTRHKRTVFSGSITSEALPPHESYHLYRLGEAVIPNGGCYLWLSPSWGVQVWLDKIAGNNKKYVFYANMKFSGPKYYPGSPNKDSIRIDRVFAVEQ